MCQLYQSKAACCDPVGHYRHASFDNKTTFPDPWVSLEISLALTDEYCDSDMPVRLLPDPVCHNTIHC